MREQMTDTVTEAYFTTALDHFQYDHSPAFEKSSLLKLASINLLEDKSIADSLFSAALTLSHQTSDTIFLAEYLQHAALDALTAKNYSLAKSLALKSIELGNNSPVIYAYASMAYSGQHQPDSARVILEKIPQPSSREDKMFYHRACAELARSLNQMDEYVYHDDLAGCLSDTIFDESLQLQMKEVEQKFENQLLRERVQRSRVTIWLIVITLFLVMSLAAYLSSRLIRQSREREMADIRLQQAIDNLSGYRNIVILLLKKSFKSPVFNLRLLPCRPINDHCHSTIKTDYQRPPGQAKLG